MARIEKWDEVHGTQAPDERMMAFLDSATDQYAILQLRRSEDTVYERFSSMRELERMGLKPDIDHYEVVYTAPLLPYKDQNTMLEELYAKFNVSRPDDFTGHSLSVSDIVALRQNGVVSCHYVDSIGFQELPGFLKPENYLKAAEMAMEDDYGMIDGVINNGKKEEPAEKASVLDQLKEKQEVVPPAPPRRCCEEKELYMRFTDDEWMLMMLYSPGTRTGLIAELQMMQKSLTGRDRNLRRWTASLLAKLAEMTDAEYEALDLYPDE